MVASKKLGSSTASSFCQFILGILLLFAFVSYITFFTNDSPIHYAGIKLLGNSSDVTRKYFFSDSNNGWLQKREQQIVTGDIDLVSLTIGSDFHVLFNNSAITSWIRHIQNVRTITFVGPPKDYSTFEQNMKTHYPELTLVSQDQDPERRLNNNNQQRIVPIRWVNETHWIEKYMDPYKKIKKMPCPYWKACQQLIKLHIFEIRTELGLDLSDNVLMVDSDTVWGRNATFVNKRNGKAAYFEVEEGGSQCTKMDAVQFTESITRGPLLENNNTAMLDTRSPYKACSRPEYTNSNGRRHIAHHMLFQYDVMTNLHNTVKKVWNTTSLWDASMKCYSFEYCKSRVSEFELYFAFVSEQYPQRVFVETIRQGQNYMAGSAICDEQEMECCREKSVLLKGCHDHRIKLWKKNPASVGDMCCPKK